LFDRVHDLTGKRPELISGDREAELTANGVKASLPDFKEGIIVDIGGGSTEWITVQKNESLNTGSLQTGVVTLMERCVEGKSWNQKTEQCVDRELETKFDCHLNKESNLVVVGGTGTTLSSIIQGLTEYEPVNVHRHLVEREQIENVIKSMKNRTYEELSREPMIMDGREDVIIPGGKILLRCMDELSINKVTVSEYGILAGYIWERITE
jgi:exopolyphosphatase/guanosine-5'-triphosphate,3'-diphosphate pyrophosphatase